MGWLTVSCPECGYDLSGLDAASGAVTCPECGHIESVDEDGRPVAERLMPSQQRVVLELMGVPIGLSLAGVVTFGLASLAAWLIGVDTDGVKQFGGAAIVLGGPLFALFWPPIVGTSMVCSWEISRKRMRTWWRLVPLCWLGSLVATAFIPVMFSQLTR